MKVKWIIIVLLATAGLHLNGSAQSSSGGGDGFAIRTNLLTLLNLDGSLELEYGLSDKVGIHVGGGVKSPVADLGMMEGFDRSGSGIRGWGLTGGCRVMFRIAGVEGFSVKGSLTYVNRSIRDFPDSVTVGLPGAVSYTTSTVGGYVGIAYTRVFGGRFFIEPVIGLGPAFTAQNTAPGRFGFGYVQIPAQLNVGVRL